MKNGHKAIPETEVTINGETVKLTLDYETLERYERTTGKVGGSLTNPNEWLGIGNAIALLFSALHHKDEKFTRAYIRKNMTRRLMFDMTERVFPNCVNNAFDFKEFREEDEDKLLSKLPGSEEESESAESDEEKKK